MRDTHDGPMTGRRRIVTAHSKIDIDNVGKVMDEALPLHWLNAAETRVLWKYYKGVQPVLGREKTSRPEICNRIVENHAREAVSFKVGYQLSEPMTYVPRSGEDDDPSGHIESEDALVDNVRTLNTMCYAADKAACDHDLFEWMCVCGVGYRMVDAVPAKERSDGDAPFRLHSLDPRNTFVIYSNSYDHRPLAGVWIGKDPSSRKSNVYNVYTRDAYYVKRGESGWKKHDNALGIRIFEYELNNSRMGVFEPALDILNAINTIESNRVDGIEQTVQALLVFDNVRLEADQFDEMRERGALMTRSVEGCSGKVYSVNVNLDQSQAQTAKDDLYAQFANIVGMPNISGTSGSSSDTGAAVMLRDGWTLAESHAKSYELKFKRSEREMLRTLLDICRVQTDESVSLRIRDIEMAFNRRNYENVLTKAQTLTMMLSDDRIDPELAFEQCGLFTDPTSAYLQSKAHYEQVSEEKAQNPLLSDYQAEAGAELGGDNEYDEAMSKASEMNRVAQETGAHQ